MRVAIMGTGGVGGVFGAMLSAAGADVWFIARGAHLAVMRKSGLRIEGEGENVHVWPINATDDPGSIGVVDFVLFCVKLWDLESSAPSLRPLLGPDTAVITLQNGLDAPELLARVLGTRHIMGGVARVSARIVAPGCIRQVGVMRHITFGELSRGLSKRGDVFLSWCRRANLGATHSESIQVDLWTKFLTLSTNAAFCAASRVPIGVVMANPTLRAFWLAGLGEVAALAHAKGVSLGPDAVERAAAQMNKWPPNVMASMAHDLIAGHRLELPWLSGKVLALGRELGVPTPVHALLHALLLPHVNGPPGVPTGQVVAKL